MTRDSLFCADTPPLTELCSVLITLPDNPNGAQSFQPQVIKCRELIFTEADILATPLLGRERQVQIILPIPLYKTGRLQSRIQKMGIAMEKPKRVTAADFQACFTYTLTARIAPLWNKVGEIFVQGRDFVSSTQKLNAIRLDVTVSDSEMYLALSAKLVRNPPINLEALSVCPMATESFFADASPFACIQEFAIENQWCSVLPSMKKGEVVGVRKQLPRDGLFHSYKDVKKYWKNMYGYRLPESDEGMLYYQVYFKLIGHKLFTYPEVCLRSRDMTTFNCPDVKSVLQQLLADIRSKMAVVCGRKFEIQTRALYLEKGLTSAQQLDENQSCNLTQKKSADKSQYRPLSTQSRSFQTWVPSGSKLDQHHVDQCSHSNDRNSGNRQCTSSQQHSISQSNQRPENSRREDHKSSKTNVEEVPSEENVKVTRVRNGVEVSVSSGSLNDARKTPNSEFSRNLNLNSAVSDSGYSSEQSVNLMQTSPGFKLPNSHSNETERKLVPVFKARLKPPFRSSQLVGNTCKVPKAVPMFKNSQKPRPRTSATSSTNDMFSDMEKLKSKLKLGNSIENESEKPASATQKNQSISNRPVFSAVITQRKSNGVNPSAYPTSSIRVPLKSAAAPSAPVSQKHVPHSRHSLEQGQTVILPTNLIKSQTVKRPIEAEGEVKAKKPRAKPKVQDNVDMAQLAATNQLHKLNTATLAAWLKERQLPCKSKDKKEWLIARIKTVFNITVPEQ